ncbi:MAG: hypothetical protein C4537_02550 [Acholeplasma sp.]|jgi:DMSO/TMAO reductase YedYZ heme-binding membrane subunit|nr:MAG: hypothetical protein C4537_02550 [Acholeplasma sp.]
MTFLTANLSIILALLIYALIHFYNKWIHKQARWFIIGSLLLATLVLFVDIPLLTFIIDRGHLTLAFFILIMFAGVMKKTWVPYKKILLVRGDLAIMGFIFLLPHGIERLSLALGGYNTSGLIAGIIMIPLTLSSFMPIRKKIRPDRWKKLHKLAYVAYLMIYFHLGFDVFIDASNGYISLSPNSILFHLLFVTYLVLKILRIREKKVQLIS